MILPGEGVSLCNLLNGISKATCFPVSKIFLSGRYLKVRVGSCISSAYPQEEGLPQGSVLSPTLFMVAINGLLGQVPAGVHGLAFADDYAVICSKSSAVEACHRSRLLSMLQHHGLVLEGSNFLQKKLRLYDFAGCEEWKRSLLYF